jgi:hypothetical protein
VIVDPTRCEKKSERLTIVLFPFAPLDPKEWVSLFLLGSRVDAWPRLGAGPLGRVG